MYYAKIAKQLLLSNLKYNKKQKKLKFIVRFFNMILWVNPKTK